MQDISTIDPHLAVKNAIGKDDVVLYDPSQEPFTLYGVYYEDGAYRRMPMRVAEKVNDGVRDLSLNTAGGRIAFKTNSPYVALSCKRQSCWRMPHMALTGSAGFCLFIKEKDGYDYYGTFVPTNSMAGYETVLDFPDARERDLLIYFPLYCPIAECMIGLKEGASLEKWSGYKYEKPMVFYGSSITQGGCASVSGNDYIARLSRRFDSNYINLGFSGSAKGEDVMMDYLAGLDMSMFIYDYDHNAPTIEHLKETHYKGYKKIRDTHPTLPIVMASRPAYDTARDNTVHERHDIIKANYEKALAEGDTNVYFVDFAKECPRFFRDACAVDGSHPTDLGFYFMAEAFGKELAKIFAKMNQ